MSTCLLRKATYLALSVLAGHCYAQSNVTVYGIMDGGVENSRAGKGSLTRQISGGSLGSRLGFRGSEDLGSGLFAVFRIEQGLTLDDGALGQGGRAWGREASVGLSSKTAGTVLLGRLPTPYYLMQSNVDAFLWMGGGSLVGITRSGTTSQQIVPLAINARADNAAAYASPNIGGFEVRLLGALGEASTTIGRQYSASARYSAQGLDALVGWNRQNGANNANGSVSALVAGGSYDFGVARVFAGYTDEKNDCTTCTGGLARVSGVTGSSASEFRLLNVGTRVPIGLFTAIAQYVRVNDRSKYAINPGSRDVNWFALGGEYAFSKRTIVYGSAATLKNRNGSQYALGSGTAQQVANFVATGDPRTTTVTLGIRHAF